jgi:hypothetical protein
MRWKDLFRGWKIPGEILEMLSDGIVVENSQFGDDCPSFNSRLANGKVLSIKVGHQDVQARSVGCLTRFTLVLKKRWSDNHGKEIYFTNNIDDLVIEFYSVYTDNGGQSSKFRLLGS